MGIETTPWAGRSGNRISLGARFSAFVHTGLGANAAYCAVGTKSYPTVKRPGCLEHKLKSSAEVKERVEI